MMKTRRHPIFYLGLLLWLGTACSEEVHYLDSHYPGLTPTLYAEGIVNQAGKFTQNLTMSPDGREQYFTETNADEWRYLRILRVSMTGNSSPVIDTPRFVTDFHYTHEQFIGEPMLSPDNQQLYFVADYPPDLWYTDRLENGSWNSPKRLETISTERDDWYITFSKNGRLLFTNGTAYTSAPENGKYLKREKLEAPFNGTDVRDPVIAPNEDYIIYCAKVSDAEDQTDLFVSFKNAEGQWGEGHRLGDAINTSAYELGSYISPDEKYLFFSRRDQWNNANFSNVYWVSLDIIDPYRND